MARSRLLSGGLLIVTLGAAEAQTTVPDIRLRLAGGLSSQQLIGLELGHPGITGALGLELSDGRQLSARLEYQGFLFAGAGYDAVGEFTPEPRQVNHVHAVVLAGTWRPPRMRRLELAFGPGAYRAESDTPAGMVSSLGIMAGAGVRLSPRITLEAQYHRATLDDARAQMPMRLSVAF